MCTSYLFNITCRNLISSVCLGCMLMKLKSFPFRLAHLGQIGLLCLFSILHLFRTVPTYCNNALCNFCLHHYPFTKNIRSTPNDKAFTHLNFICSNIRNPSYLTIHITSYRSKNHTLKKKTSRFR